MDQDRCQQAKNGLIRMDINEILKCIYKEPYNTSVRKNITYSLSQPTYITLEMIDKIKTRKYGSIKYDSTYYDTMIATDIVMRDHIEASKRWINMVDTSYIKGYNKGLDVGYSNSKESCYY